VSIKTLQNTTFERYGKNIQRLGLITSTANRRSWKAYPKVLLQSLSIIKNFNPTLGKQEKRPKTLGWTCYIMSDFKLDVDAPFPMPEENRICWKRPMPIGLSKRWSEIKSTDERNIEKTQWDRLSKIGGRWRAGKLRFIYCRPVMRSFHTRLGKSRYFDDGNFPSTNDQEPYPKVNCTFWIWAKPVRKKNSSSSPKTRKRLQTTYRCRILQGKNKRNSVHNKNRRPVGPQKNDEN